jgi:putative MATE family efflux protein
MSSHPRQRAGGRDLATGSLGWNLFRLAGPVALGTFLAAFYGLVDTFWLGRWTNEAVAAQSVSMPYFFIVFALVMAFATAGSSVVSQYTGAGRHDEADRAVGQMFLVLGFFATSLALPLALLAPHLLRLVQAPAETVGPGTSYMQIAMIGLPFMAFSAAYGASLRALGNTQTVVLISVGTNLLNLLLDPVMIFGLGGMPALGVGGAALATMFSQVTHAAVCYALLRTGHMGLRVGREHLRPDGPMLLKITRIAVPLAVNRSSDSWAFFFFRMIINSMGLTVLTAFAIGFRILRFFTMPAMAMGMAAAPIVGQALGAGKPQLARRAVWISAAITACVLLPPLIFMMGFGRVVARIFHADPEVLAEAKVFFLVVPASTYCFHIASVLTAAFTGSGHTRPPMVISLVRQWIFRLPVAYLLGITAGLGGLGVYLGMVVGNVVCALLTLWVFLKGGWQSAAVLRRPAAVQEGEAEMPGAGGKP